MKRNRAKQWVAALMVVAALLMALPVAAQKPAKMNKAKVTNYSDDPAHWTADGYSLWDGKSWEVTPIENGVICIYNAAQLSSYAADVYYDRRYWNSTPYITARLMVDIDLGGNALTIGGGEKGLGKNGFFDGNGHTIRNGHAKNAKDNRCAFISQAIGAKIKNLVLENYHVYYDGILNNDYHGILCAYAKSTHDVYPWAQTVYYPVQIEHVRLVNCSVRGDGTNVGGLIGELSNEVERYAENVRGWVEYGTNIRDNIIENCTIEGEDVVGGLVGKCVADNFEHNLVINCKISGEDNVGGLFGFCDHEEWLSYMRDVYKKFRLFTNTVWNSSISGTKYVGGAFGRFTNSNDDNRMSFHPHHNLICATVSSDDDDDYVGAFAGYIDDEVIFSASRNYYNQDYYTGAINPVGREPENWTNNDRVALPEGKTSEELRGFTLGGTLSNTSDVLYQYTTIPNLWPQLHSSLFNNVNDTIITTPEQLVTFAMKVNGGVEKYSGHMVRLGADIDMMGVLMPTIGTTDHPFMGEFNGQGHTIRNLTITSANDNVGLFGCLMNAYVHNLRIDGASVLGQNHVGVLFGSTVFSPCYISDVLVENSSVTGLGSVGGIGGRVAESKNLAYATIERCYFNNGTVTTAYANANDAAWAGGICGNVLHGVITDCGCLATISRSTSGELKAGLIGGTNGTLTVTRCYATDLNNNRLALVNGRGSDAAVTENNCPAAIASQEGMKTDLGDYWIYFTEEGQTKLPVPASMDKYYNGMLTVQQGDFVFFPNDAEASSYYVKEYIGGGGAVIIPATITAGGTSKPVTKINYEVFNHRSDVTSVTLPEGLQYIGNKAFYGTGITTLSLPNSITGVGNEAFAACPSLTSISIGSGTKGMNDDSFSKCPNLETITIADGNTEMKAVGGVLFSADGTDLLLCAPKGATKGNYTVPSNVDYIPYYAFDYCTQLTGITFPSSLRTTGYYLFTGCDNLRYLDFSQCTDWAQGLWGIGAGVTVHRNPIGLEDKTFAGVPEQTIIYLPAGKSHDAGGEKNVVIGGEGTDLVLADGWDFDPKVSFTFPSGSYDRSFASNVITSTELLRDENGEPVLEEQYVLDDDGKVVMNGDEPLTEQVQVFTTTYSEEEKGYTICLPFAWTLNLDEEDAAKVYAPTEIADIEGVTTVTFSEVEGGELAAYTPYYIVVSSGLVTVNGQGGSVSQHQTSGTTVIDGARYQLKGSTVTIANATLYDVQKPAYILQSDRRWHKVPQDAPQAYVGAFRAYFQAIDGNAHAPSLSMMLGGSYHPNEENGGATAIRTIDRDGTERYFDLGGRRLPGKGQNGIYLMNGKKYVNK